LPLACTTTEEAAPALLLLQRWISQTSTAGRRCHLCGQAFNVLGGKTIPQKVWARSSCSTNSIAYVETPSAAANCATTRAEIWVPCLLFTETTEPTRSSRLSRTAAPCLFNFVALAGIVKEHFCRSSPDNPIEAWSAMRLLRRFATWLRPAVALAARFGRCDLGGCAGFRFILIATLECARGRCNVPFVTSPGYPAELLDSSNRETRCITPGNRTCTRPATEARTGAESQFTLGQQQSPWSGMHWHRHHSTPKHKPRQACAS